MSFLCRSQWLFLCVIFACLFHIYRAQAQEIPLGAALDAPIATERSISLEMKDMDIADALAAVSEKAGLSVVIGKNVSGKVTLYIKDVDPAEAFEMILMSNDLACEKKGNICHVLTQREYEALHGERYGSGLISETVKLKYASARSLCEWLVQLKSPFGKVIADNALNALIVVDNPLKVAQMLSYIRQADAPGLDTQVFALRYARAAKLAAKIQDRLTPGCGSFKADEETNKIAVTDYPQKVREIAVLLREFDDRPRQVLIDAQIIEVSPTDKFEMGVDWDYWVKKHFRAAGQLPLGNSNRLVMGTPQETPQGTGQYKAVIDMLRTIGNVRILSSPRIMVLNNEQAKILVGTKDVYITSSVSVLESDDSISSQTVNFIDVGIKLFVTPFINNEGYVIMRIHPEVSSSQRADILSQGRVTQIPVVSTSETETTVMLRDGVTLFIAGLNKEEKSRTVRKIPLLGDVPLLGVLFRSLNEESKKTELVVLLTPHLVDGGTGEYKSALLLQRPAFHSRLVLGPRLLIPVEFSRDKAP